MRKLIQKMAVIFGLLFFIGTPVITMAETTGFSQLEQGGTEAKETAKGLVSNWRWVVMILPLGIATLFYMAVGKWLTEENEKSQTRPKAQRIFFYFTVVFLGILTGYAVIGIFALTFLSMSFSEAWTFFIVTPMREIFSIV